MSDTTEAPATRLEVIKGLLWEAANHYNDDPDILAGKLKGMMDSVEEHARLGTPPVLAPEPSEGALRDPDLWAVEPVDPTYHLDDPMWHCDEADAWGDASERAKDRHADWIADGNDGDEPKESDYTVVGVWIGNPLAEPPEGERETKRIAAAAFTAGWLAGEGGMEGDSGMMVAAEARYLSALAPSTQGDGE